MKRVFLLLMSIVLLLTGCSNIHKNSDGSADVSDSKSSRIEHVYVLSEDGVICEFTANQLKVFKKALKDGFHALEPTDKTVFTDYVTEREKYKHRDYSKCIQPYYWGATNGSKVEYSKEYKQYLKDINNAPVIWDFSVAPFRIISYDKDMNNIDIGTFRFDEYMNMFYSSYVVDDEVLTRFMSTVDLSAEAKPLKDYNLSKDKLPKEEKFDKSLSVIRQMEYEDYYDENGNQRSKEEIERRRQEKLKQPVTVEEEQTDGTTEQKQIN